jgi:hypothetical protein
VDDTGARHRATNGFCTQIGNDHFTWFGTTGSVAKACFKLAVGFWDYLGARLNAPGCQSIPPLPELILAKARSL